MLKNEEVVMKFGLRSNVLLLGLSFADGFLAGNALPGEGLLLIGALGALGAKAIGLLDLFSLFAVLPSDDGKTSPYHSRR